METITKPTIPAEEYPQRWARVQAMMERERLDLLVAYADDRAVFGAAHARWLANFPVHFEPVCILLFRQSPPIMLCGPETREYALRASRLPDIRVLREFTHPDEDYPFSTIQSLAEVVGEVIPDPVSVRRIGLAGRGLMSADVLAAFQGSFPHANWADVENAMCDVRARKSPCSIATWRPRRPSPNRSRGSRSRAT